MRCSQGNRSDGFAASQSILISEPTHTFTIPPQHHHICFGCNHHLKMSSAERIEHLIDPGTWRAFDETLSPVDPLEFTDQKAYIDRISIAQKATGLQDAVVTGTGLLHGIPVALGVMEFAYMGGSMGSVVGEKLTRLIEYATQEGLALMIVCTSGGARMQEGILSLVRNNLYRELSPPPPP